MCYFQINVCHNNICCCIYALNFRKFLGYMCILLYDTHISPLFAKLCLQWVHNYFTTHSLLLHHSFATTSLLIRNSLLQPSVQLLRNCFATTVPLLCNLCTAASQLICRSFMAHHHFAITSPLLRGCLATPSQLLYCSLTASYYFIASAQLLRNSFATTSFVSNLHVKLFRCYLTVMIYDMVGTDYCMTGSGVRWAECLLIIGTGCRVQVF